MASSGKPEEEVVAGEGDTCDDGDEGVAQPTATSHPPHDTTTSQLNGDSNISQPVTDPPSPHSKSDTVDWGCLKSDGSDSRWLGLGRPIKDRPDAAMPVAPLESEYNMRHKRRGVAILFVYEHYGKGGPQPRPNARHDVNITRNAFKKLQFEVQECWNQEQRDFLRQLQKVADEDHSSCDGLVVVLMSHGGVHEKTNKEFIWTYDRKVYTDELWKNFTAEKCPTLAGKPKMFFIQACRGEDTDKGIRLRRGLAVETDSSNRFEPQDYVIPLHADMLIMWASYPGMFAFKSSNMGMKGSVFLHFLAKVLQEDAKTSDLLAMLVRVTREVAVHYESYVPGTPLHQNKQIPYTVSTLMRSVRF